MAQANKDQVNVTIVSNDDQQPSTSKQENPTLQKERSRLLSWDQFRNIPSWKFGQTRKGSTRSSGSSRGSSHDEEHKVEVPNVLRESMTTSKIIPPLPRLSMNEEMDEKLTRMLRKLDKLMLTKPLEEEADKSPPKSGALKVSSSKAKVE